MLKGKVAIVTGSTSGIGRGIATALATDGADVMLNGWGDRAEIDRVAKDLEERHSVRTGYSPTDMSRPAEIRQLIADTQRLLGPVDVLVNNAGIQHVAPVEQFPEERWNAILAINL